MESSQKQNTGLLQKLVIIYYKYIKPEFLQIFRGFGNLSPFFSKGGRMDKTFFLIVTGLTVFGLATHYSASYENLWQLVFAVIGIFVMLIVAHVNVNVYKELSSAFVALCFLLLIAVLFRTDYNGTHRRLFFFQPSEIAKIAFIMWMAYLIDKYKKNHNSGKQFWAFLIITGVFGVMLILESHLSGAILFIGIGYAMMWYGDMPKRNFAFVTAVIIAVLLIVVWKPTVLLRVPGIHEYQINRILIWKKVLSGGNFTAKERLGDARQILQSLYGIGSGGLLGVGFGQSGQKVNNLSEKANDFIFAVLAEEGGFFIAILMLALFGFLVYKGFKIANNSRTYYGSLLVLGISTQMALQVLLNVAVATSVLPNTGISLPFFSDGGTSMVFSLASMGLVLGVSKDSRGVKDVKSR